MTKRLLISLIVVLGLGFILLNPWIFAYYLIVLIIATVIVLGIVISSLFKGKKTWKMPLFYLTIFYLAGLTSYGINSYQSLQIIQKRNQVIRGLYDYHNKNGQFPKSLDYASFNVRSIRATYLTDSSLQSFMLYTKDIYGFPWVFNSKDSTWGR